MFDTYAEIFERRAIEYHTAMRQSPNARDSEFLSALEPLRDAPPGLLCDMPSGGGYLAAHLWPGMDYLAVDPASDFFLAWPKTLKRLIADIKSVPLPDHSVDYIVSLVGLHHEPDLALAFQEMRRLVRPGGRVVIVDVAVDTPPARFLNGFVARNCPLGHDGRFLDDRTCATLQVAGLEVVSDQLVETPWRFESLDEAGEFARYLFGVTELEPTAVADALAAEIGFGGDKGQPQLRWMLRRIVCDVG